MHISKASKMASIFNVVSDVQNILFPSGKVRLEVEQTNQTTYMIYITSPHSNKIGRVELLVEYEGNDPDPYVVGSVFSRGPVTRNALEVIMDSILERL